AQHLRQTQRPAAVADEDGLNRCEAVHQLKADRFGALAELLDQSLEVLATPVLGAQQFKAFQRGARQPRRLTGGVDIRASELDQGFDQFLAASNEGACRTEGFTEGA
nr:hypothetical protein [Tanacetum cinerariifolium]